MDKDSSFFNKLLLKERERGVMVNFMQLRDVQIAGKMLFLDVSGKMAVEFQSGDLSNEPRPSQMWGEVAWCSPSRA